MNFPACDFCIFATFFKWFLKIASSLPKTFIIARKFPYSFFFRQGFCYYLPVLCPQNAISCSEQSSTASTTNFRMRKFFWYLSFLSLVPALVGPSNVIQNLWLFLTSQYDNLLIHVLSFIRFTNILEGFLYKILSWFICCLVFEWNAHFSRSILKFFAINVSPFISDLWQLIWDHLFFTNYDNSFLKHWILNRENGVSIRIHIFQCH